MCTRRGAEFPKECADLVGRFFAGSIRASERDYLMPAGGTMEALNELASSCAQRIYKAGSQPCAYIRETGAACAQPFLIYAAVPSEPTLFCLRVC